MKTIYRFDEERAIWWSWQDLRGDWYATGESKKPTGFCTHGRAWLHWPTNSVGIEWGLFDWACGFSITFDSCHDEAIQLHLAIPFLFSVWLSLTRCDWVKYLPGVKWSGKYGSGEREINLRVHSWAFWWNLWTYPGESYDRWNEGCFHIDDFFLGRNEHSESPREHYDTFLEMPEGAYPVTVELYTSTWTRKRCPWIRRSVRRAKIEIEGGVPVPGKGENSYDCDDDAIFSSTAPAASVDEALRALKESVLHDRCRHGGDGWEPSEGWPAHCLRRDG